jgi:hypothetical protein
VHNLFLVTLGKSKRESSLVNLEANSHNTAQHNGLVTLKDSNATKGLRLVEGVDDDRVLGVNLKLDHGNIVSLDILGVLSLGLVGLLTDLPDDAEDLAGSLSGLNLNDGGVALLELSGVVQNLNLSLEGLGGLEGGILLDDHDISGLGEVILVQTLNVDTNVETALSAVNLLVVHLDGEDLSDARVGLSVRGEENNLISRLEGTLLDLSSDDISDTLDVKDVGNGHTGGEVRGTLGDLNELVKGIVNGDDGLSGTISGLHGGTLPPRHVGGLLEEVVTLEARDGEDGDGLINELGVPADLAENVADLIANLVVTGLSVLGDIGVHLVDANDQLLNTEQVQETGVLTGLTLDLTCLSITLGKGSGEVTISGNHDDSDISLRGTGDHVLHEISVAGGINDGVVEVGGVELLGGALDSDTTLTLLLGGVQEEGKGERSLTHLVSKLLHLLQLTLGDTTELVHQVTSGGGLAGIDVSADNHRHVDLTRSRFSHFGRC